MVRPRGARRVAVGTVDGVTIYDAASGTPIGKLERKDLRAVYISPVNHSLSAHSRTSSCNTTSTPCSRCGLSAGTPASSRRSIQTPSGTLLQSRSGAGDINLFDVASGERIATTIHIPEGEDPGDHFRPDGKELLTGGSDKTGTLYWDLDPQPWLDAACRQAGRNLTADEWASYIGKLAPHRPTCPGADPR